MEGHPAIQSPSLTPTLVLGPGARLEVLSRLLREEGLDPMELREVADVHNERGYLLLDGETIGARDARRLGKILNDRPGWRLVLIGNKLARETEFLGHHPRARILSWPLEADALSWISRGHLPLHRALPQQAAGGSPDPQPESTQNGTQVATPPELATIEAILEGRSEEERRSTRPGPPSASSSNGTASTSLAFSEEQVAELADIATCLELSMSVANQDAQRLEAQRDLDRLIRFTRTLGNAARKPALTLQEVDLSQVIGSILARRSALSEREVLFWSQGLAPARVDQGLLATALESLLDFAEACCRPDQAPRLALRRESSHLAVHLDFPLGPLAGLEIPDLAQPYALREVLPEFGTSDLAAARSVLASHGAQLLFGQDPESGRQWAHFELELTS